MPRLFPACALLWCLPLVGSNTALAADWDIVVEESRIAFSGVQVGDIRFEGEFQSFTGTVTFDPATPETATAALTIDMASAVTGNEQRNRILQMTEWLNVAGYPTATFSLQNLAPLDSGAYTATGRLTIRGLARSIQSDLQIRENGSLVCAAGALTIDRRDFQIGTGDWGETEEWVRFPVDITYRLCTRPES